MDIRTYEGISIRDAIKKVKKELGDEAVILSSKEHIKPGASGLKTYEITATTAGTSSQLYPRSTFQKPELGDLDEKLKNVQLKLNTLQNNILHNKQFENLESSVHELKLMMLEQLKATEGQSTKNIPSKLIDIERQLRITGVDYTHLNRLMDYLQTQIEAPSQFLGDLSPQKYRSLAIEWMFQQIQIAPSWQFLDGSPYIGVFVGAHGSGKTTMISKLASHYKKRHKKKVLLVSYNQQHLAAKDKLTIISKILDIPLIMINTPQELEDALLRHRDRELVLIDTDGVNPKQPVSINELKRLKEAHIPFDVHLLVPLTNKQNQNDKSIQLFSQLAIQSLIFTRLDESWTYGDIFNLGVKWSVPLSYFSTGTEVPQGMERASKERVVERLFLVHP